MVAFTLFAYRGPQINTGVFPYRDHPWWTFTSNVVAKVLHPLGFTTNHWIETVFILGQVAVIFGFLVIVVYSKPLHIFLAPVNVTVKRNPDGVAFAQKVLPTSCAPAASELHLSSVSRSRK